MIVLRSVPWRRLRKQDNLIRHSESKMSKVGNFCGVDIRLPEYQHVFSFDVAVDNGRRPITLVIFNRDHPGGLQRSCILCIAIAISTQRSSLSVMPARLPLSGLMDRPRSPKGDFSNTSTGIMSSLCWGIFQHEPWILMMFGWFQIQW